MDNIDHNPSATTSKLPFYETSISLLQHHQHWRRKIKRPPNSWQFSTLVCAPSHWQHQGFTCTGYHCDIPEQRQFQATCQRTPPLAEAHPAEPTKGKFCTGKHIMGGISCKSAGISMSWNLSHNTVPTVPRQFPYSGYDESTRWMWWRKQWNILTLARLQLSH